MRKYYGIELLRFLASLCIVLFHWGFSFAVLDLAEEKTYSHILNKIYLNGGVAVSIFFVISGIVFSNIYLDKENKSSFKDFFIKRFARLYPLHILTLFLIIGIQFLFLRNFGDYQLYEDNSFYHFILNIFLLLGLGFEDGKSFNQPVWSVAIEIYVYFIFFFLITLIKKFQITAVICVYSIILIIDKSNIIGLDFLNRNENYTVPFLDYARLFFSGVFLFLIEKKIKNLKYLLIGTVFLLILTTLVKFYFFIFIPSLVMLFILFDRIITSNILKKIFSIMGNLTYSMYLIHTVSFLCLLYVLKTMDKISFFASSLSFWLYVVGTILISLLSFYYIEKPLNIKIREKLIK